MSEIKQRDGEEDDEGEKNAREQVWKAFEMKEEIPEAEENIIKMIVEKYSDEEIGSVVVGNCDVKPANSKAKKVRQMLNHARGL